MLISDKTFKVYLKEVFGKLEMRKRGICVKQKKKSESQKTDQNFAI